MENHVKLLTGSIKEKFPIAVLCCNTKRKTEVEEKDRTPTGLRQNINLQDQSFRVDINLF